MYASFHGYKFAFFIPIHIPRPSAFYHSTMSLILLCLYLAYADLPRRQITKTNKTLKSFSCTFFTSSYLQITSETFEKYRERADDGSASQSSLYNVPELFWVRQLGQILFHAQNDYPICDFQNICMTLFSFFRNEWERKNAR